VSRIIHDDLGLKCLKKRRAQELTEAYRAVRFQRAKKASGYVPRRQSGLHLVHDEKVFTVAIPKNPQNDRLYVPATVKKKHVAAERLLRTRTTFSRSVMVSVGVSKLGCTDLIFVDPGVKINGAYYRDVLLSQQLLPMMRDVSESSSFFSKTVLPRIERMTLSDFWNRRRQLSFHWICGHRTAPISIRSTTRSGASCSNASTSRV